MSCRSDAVAAAFLSGRRIPILNRITSLQNGKEAVVIGTLYKSMKKKIRVLDEFLDDVSVFELSEEGCTWDASLPFRESRIQAPERFCGSTWPQRVESDPRYTFCPENLTGLDTS